MRKYSHEQYAALMQKLMGEMQKLAELKGGEYAGDSDRLANFRRNGEALGLPMETVWAVYAGKHWDAIQQWVKDQRADTQRERLEPIEGRIHDLMVYLTLLAAMIDESKPGNMQAAAADAKTFLQYFTQELPVELPMMEGDDVERQGIRTPLPEAEFKPLFPTMRPYADLPNPERDF